MRVRRSLTISPGIGLALLAPWLAVLCLLVLCLLALNFMLLGGPALAAAASVGVGVQAGPVRLAAAAHPGGSYALPALFVVNTGTEPESIRVTVERLSAGPGRPVPRSWIRASGPAVHLAARESARVPLLLTVPPGTRPGTYSSDVIADGSAVLSAGPANLAAAAATKLQFRVASGPPPPGTGQAAGSVPGSGSGSGLPTSLKWLLTGLVLLAVAAIAVRRSGLRIRVERADGRGLADDQGGHDVA